MTSLAAADRQRLAKLLGMAGSQHDGEALNAARLADRLVRDRGATWHDVVNPAVNDRQLPERNPRWRATVAECLRRRGSLRPWESGFLESLASFPRLSPKQGRILNEIVARVLRREAA